MLRAKDRGERENICEEERGGTSEKIDRESLISVCVKERERMRKVSKVREKNQQNNILLKCWKSDYDLDNDKNTSCFF